MKRRERICGKKQAYTTQAAATAAKNALVADRGIYGPNLTTYRCKVCGHFHIGHRMGLGRDRHR